ncbi:MAG: hypothetical protein DLM50_06670 [Candidatus Meridianibacter frigidus]|nr:MAG: hypothetical protein DLM50_06670 [Candidatus Eremiobacteraeota bacterium]
MTDQSDCIVGLGARVRIFVRPAFRQRFTALFRDVLGCKVIERDFGLTHPILFVPFPDGSGFSVEFSELAPGEYTANTIDDEHAFHGAWIEFRTADLPGCKQRLRDAGVAEFRHPGSTHSYFSAPGGQVFRLLDLAYKGP